MHPSQSEHVLLLLVRIDLGAMERVDDLRGLVVGALRFVDLGQPVQRLEVLGHELEAAPIGRLGPAPVGHVPLVDVAEGEEDPA